MMGEGQAEEVGHDNLYDWIFVVKFSPEMIFLFIIRPYMCHSHEFTSARLCIGTLEMIKFMALICG